jgi:hypothetical protein
MFKLLLYTILLNLTLSVSSFAQINPVQSKPNFDQSEVDRLLKKSKNQKITAWSMLGGGTLLIIMGIVVSPDDEYYVYDPMGNIIEDTPAPTSAYLAGAGLLSMAGSIPFFISSGKNKKKARAMVSTTYYPNPAVPTQLIAMPSAGIQITIR